MKLAIIGSRDCPQIDIMAHLKHLPTEVISGGARGADTYAREFAHKYNLPLTEYLPDYDKYGKNAPLVRNKLIVENCDCLIAFWDGKSRGTKFTLDYAKEKQKNIKVVYLNTNVIEIYKICPDENIYRLFFYSDENAISYLKNTPYKLKEKCENGEVATRCYYCAMCGCYHLTSLPATVRKIIPLKYNKVEKTKEEAVLPIKELPIIKSEKTISKEEELELLSLNRKIVYDQEYFDTVYEEALDELLWLEEEERERIREEVEKREEGRLKEKCNYKKVNTQILWDCSGDDLSIYPIFW